MLYYVIVIALKNIYVHFLCIKKEEKCGKLVGWISSPLVPLLGSLSLENHIFGYLYSLRASTPLRNIGHKCPNCPKRPN